MTHEPLTQQQLEDAYNKALRTLPATKTPGLISWGELQNFDHTFWALWETLGHKQPEDPALTQAKKNRRAEQTPNELLAEFKEATSNIPLALIGFQHWLTEAAKDMSLIPELTKTAHALTHAIEEQNERLRLKIKENQ